MSFRIGQTVRVNSGEYYGMLGKLDSKDGDQFTVWVPSVGAVVVASIIDPNANNGD